MRIPRASGATNAIKARAGYIAVVAMVAIWTLILHTLSASGRQIPGVLYFYILIISLSAILWSLPETLFAVVLSVIAADLWVVPPSSRFQPDLEHGLRLLVFAVVALTQSMVQSRLVETRKQLRTQFEIQQHIAQTLQSALLPKQVVAPGYETALLYKPASQDAHVGGDFLDIFELDAGRFGLLLGDMTGHGVEAAVQTAQVRYTLRAYAMQDNGPADCLAAVNTALSKDRHFENFATIFFAILDIRRHLLTYASAGHEPALLCDASRNIQPLLAGGLPVGIASSATAAYFDSCISLLPSQSLVVYTDGVTEARNASREFYGVERLQHTVAELSEKDLASASRALYDDVCSFASGPLKDDVAILWVRRSDTITARA